MMEPIDVMPGLYRGEITDRDGKRAFSGKLYLDRIPTVLPDGVRIRVTLWPDPTCAEWFAREGYGSRIRVAIGNEIARLCGIEPGRGVLRWHVLRADYSEGSLYVDPARVRPIELPLREVSGRANIIIPDPANWRPDEPVWLFAAMNGKRGDVQFAFGPRGIVSLEKDSESRAPYCPAEFTECLPAKEGYLFLRGLAVGDVLELIAETEDAPNETAEREAFVLWYSAILRRERDRARFALNPYVVNACMVASDYDPRTAIKMYAEREGIPEDIVAMGWGEAWKRVNA